MVPKQFSDWSHFIDPASIKGRGDQFLFRKNTDTFPKMYTINLAPSLPRKDV